MSPEEVKALILEHDAGKGWIEKNPKKTAGIAGVAGIVVGTGATLGVQAATSSSEETANAFAGSLVEAATDPVAEGLMGAASAALESIG